MRCRWNRIGLRCGDGGLLSVQSRAQDRGDHELTRSAEIGPGREGTGYEKKKCSVALEVRPHGVDYSHPYLAERGIAEETAIEFGVGFYPGPGLMHGRLVIPIHDSDGELVAYCGRSVDETQPRYRLPAAFAKSEILFNMHRAAAGVEKSVVVVEGFFDCMKVHQANARSVVGLMGSVLFEPQRQALLQRFRYVILLMDGDATGRKATMVIAQKLRPHCSVRAILLPDGIQPDQLTAKDIGKILHSSTNDDYQFGNISS